MGLSNAPDYGTNNGESDFSQQDVLEFVSGRIDLTKLNTAYVGLWILATTRGYQFLHYQYTYRLFPRSGEMGQLKILDSVPEHLFNNPISENDEEAAFHKHRLFDEQEYERKTSKWYEEYMKMYHPSVKE